MKQALLIFSLVLSLAFLSCGSKSKLLQEVFSYRGIMDKEFRFKTGDIVPVTSEQSVELDGDISLDGNYFYYSSNRDLGNYDIYMRLLNNITTLRITNHPSKDTSPSISPDGRRLAFVSTREDPEGDIYLVNINPDKLIKKAEESITELPSLDGSAKNLTQFQDPVTKTIRIIRDASPVWSPDGKSIAFSSTRGGGENIWTMERSGKKLTRVTSKGGRYPHFSPDGKEIIFISYREKGKGGDIYTINLATGKEKRITDTPSIELMPSYRGNSNEIIYTLIDRDTNGDGKITLKDNSVLSYYNRAVKKGYPLTLYSRSSFSAKWLPVLETQAYKGIIVYSDLVEGNININLIPETGIIPRWANALLQFMNANKFLTVENNREKYLLALERVYDFFGMKKDRESGIFTSKALSIAAYQYKNDGRTEKLNSILEKLKQLGEEKNIYSQTRYGYTLLKLRGKRGDGLISRNLQKAKADKSYGFFVPYLMEDLADEYLTTGREEKAAGTYSEIINSYPKYKRLISVHYKYAKLKYRTMTDPVSGSMELVLKKGTQYQKKEMAKHIVSIIEKSPAGPIKIRLLEGLLKKFPKEKSILGIAEFSLADNYLKEKNYKKAEEHYTLALKNISRSEVLFYRANTRLGDLALIDKNTDRAEKFISTAVNRYKEVWREPDIRKRALWLINYYESGGERAEDSGDYPRAIGLYRKYHRLMTFLNIRKFTVLYNKYGPRSHILYIDAYTKLNGSGKIDNLLKEYVGDIKRKRQDFDKAYIYGLAYIYALKAVHVEKQTGITGLNIPGLSDIRGMDKTGLEGLLLNFQNALEQVEWAIFLDDSFIEPYLLKSWIYMYVDLRRNAKEGEDDEEISRYFPKLLWEKNIEFLKKALSVNDESKQRENEGNILINMANSYFLINNFTEALNHYTGALKYKKNFGTKIEEAHFYFHTGYCHWQNNNLPEAGEEMKKALNIYNSLASGGNIRPFARQFFTFYKYFALFNRMDKNYPEAIKWYRKSMSFASRYGIKIDRARYLQEIAYCYYRSGDTDTAIENLKRAGELLKKYTPDEKTYKLTVNILKYISIPTIDLGQDAAVVGDNKIFTELTKRDKELFNISLLETISSESGNYRKAIEYQVEKIKLIKQKENIIDQVSLTTSLNNTGYYYYRLRNYPGALDYFNKAWKHASHEDVNDLEGAFTALMNLTDLYAFIIENNIGILKDPLKEISALVNSANSYKSSYEEIRYKQEFEKLKAEAKKEKRKVTEQEKTELRGQISEEANSKYSKIDTAVAILDFYWAELLSSKEIKPGAAGTESAYSYYKQSKAIYNIYSGSLKRFSDALKAAQAMNNRKLVIKLMMNMAACYSELGDTDEAYTQYLDALDLAEKYRYRDLLLNLSFKTGNFLLEYGEDVEGDNYMGEALSTLRKGRELFEKYPFLFPESFDLIKKSYRASIDILLKLNRGKEAFVYTEKMYEAVRYFLVAGTSPSFFKAKDKADYRQYLKETRTIKGLMEELSGLLETDAAEDSVEVIKLNSEITGQEKKITDLILGLEKQKRLLASYLSVKYRGIPEAENSSLIRLHKTGGDIAAWNILGGKIRYRIFHTGNEKWKEKLAEFIESAGKGKNLFVVLNRSSREILSDPDLGKRVTGDFMYIPSVSRINFYTSTKNKSFSSIYFSGTGLRSLVNQPGITITEKIPGKIDLGSYTALIDTRESGLLKPSLFFGKSVQSSFIVKDVKKIDYDYAALLAESALYSGIKTVVIAEGGDTSTLGSIVNTSYTGGFHSLNNNTTLKPRVLGIGYRGIDASRRKSILPQLQNSEFALYTENLKNRDFRSAGIHLNRWISGTDDAGSQKKFSDLLFRLNLLSGDLDAALRTIERDEKTGDKDPEKLLNSTLKKIYIFLYRGDFKLASELIKKAETSPAEKYYDYQVFKAIEELAVRGAEKPVVFQKEREEKTPGLKSLIPRARINLLYAEYLALFNKNVSALMPEALSGRDLSHREILKAAFLGLKVTDTAGLDSRTDHILKLLGEKAPADKPENEIQNFVRNNGKYDPLSSIVLLAHIKNLSGIKNNTPSGESIKNYPLEKIIKKSEMTDRLLLFKLLIEFYRAAGETEKINTLSDRYISQLRKNSFTHLLKTALYDRSIILSQLDQYPVSYRLALEVSPLMSDTEPLFPDLQLHLVDCESLLGKRGLAWERAQSLLSKKLMPEQELILNLLLSRLELQRLSKMKQATVEDAKKFDSLFTGSIKILDRDPQMIPDIKRMKLVNEIIDSYINYKMKTGSHTDALLYSEIKKQVNLRHRFRNVNSRRLLDTIPLTGIMSGIPGHSLMASLVRVGNDIFIWMLGKNFRKAFVIRNGYKRLEPVLRDYSQMMSTFDNTVSVSKRLSSLFAPLLKNLKGKKSLYIITDDSLEKVPFEIIGVREMLIDRYNLIYLTSPMAFLRTGSFSAKTVYLYGEKNKSIHLYLENIAIEESGITHQTALKIDKGIAHIHSRISYNRDSGKLYLESAEYGRIIRSPSIVYLPDLNIRGIGFNDLSLINSELGVSGVIINGASFHEMNNALFVDYFYRQLQKKSTIPEAFDKAKNRLRSMSAYQHPAFWAGIRLYLNRL